MSNPTTPSRKPRRFRWGYLLVALVLAALLFFGSLIVFPDWTRINGWVFVLLAVAFSVAVEFVANLRTAIAPDSTPDATLSMTAQMQQTSVTQSDISASGDVVVGGSKIEAGGNVAMRDIYTTIVEASAVGVIGLHQLPPPPRDFTGREAELTELMTALEKGGVTISGVQGMGGVGKTALALKLAEQLTDRYPDAQFYLDLKGADKQPLSSAEALAHVIRAYHPTAKLPESEAELHGLYQTVLHEKRALLLMDNAANAAQVEPLIPPASCVLLVTSRQHFTLPGLYAKSLDTLPPNDARDLLLKIAPRLAPTPSLPRSQTARSGEGAGFADEIAKLCGYLPLALRLAGSALAERIDLSPADYARRLADAKQRLQLIDASLSLSYDLLKPELQKLWCMLAVFPDTFDRQAATAVWALEVDEAQDAVSELVKFSLLEYAPTPTLPRSQTARSGEGAPLPSPDDSGIVVGRGAGGEVGGGRYRLHDLARLFTDSRLLDADRAAAQLRHASHYAAILSTANKLYLQGGEVLKHGLELFDLEWMNFQAGQVWAEENATKDRQALELCDEYPSNGFEILPLRQHPRQRIAWLKKGLEATRKLRRRQAEGLHLGNLGTAYADLGEIGHAIRFFEQALLIARETEDRRNEEAWLNNLGTAHVNLSKPRRAIQFYEEALAVARELGVRRDEGQILANLGAVHATLNELPRSIEYHERGLTIARDIGDRRSEGFILGNLGNVHSALGEHRRAIEFYEQRLVIAREINDLRGEAYTRFNLADELNEIGENAQAIVHAEAALKIFEQIESPYAATVRKQLAEWRGE